MNLQTVVLATLMSAATLPAVAATCDTRSGPNTAALVELYTSEGCSSCPPADRQLSQLGNILDPSAEVVPLALHVGYWDRLGWADRFAQDRFARRQEWLAQVNRQRTVYTPQFFVSGSEALAWRRSLREKVRKVNATPPSAAISLRSAFSSDVLRLDAEATTQAGNDPVVLYLAIAENGLITHVMRGENKDATLTHDHVVREWLGPFRLSGGKARVRRDVRLSAAWNRNRLETIAFVQDERSGSVLQALRAAACPGA